MEGLVMLGVSIGHELAHESCYNYQPKIFKSNTIMNKNMQFVDFGTLILNSTSRNLLLMPKNTFYLITFAR